MPLHTRVPPIKRLYDLPFTHAVAVAMMVSALNSIIYYEALGPISSSLLGFFAIAGGFLVLIGLQWRGEAAFSYIVERTGQYLCAGAWLINLYVLWALAASPLAFMTPLILLGATVFRIIGLGRDLDIVEMIQRQRIEKARGDNE